MAALYVILIGVFAMLAFAGVFTFVWVTFWFLVELLQSLI